MITYSRNINFNFLQKQLHQELHLNNSSKLLNLVEQGISFLDDLLILPVLLVWARGLNDVTHLVDLGVQATHSDEVGELSIKQVNGDSERRRHGGEHYAFVSIQKLRVRRDSVLADEVCDVGADISVVEDCGVDLHDGFEEVVVFAVVNAREEALQGRGVPNHRYHLRVFDHLGFQVRSWQ